MKEEARANLLEKIDTLNTEQLAGMIRQLRQEKKRRSSRKAKPKTQKSR